jgi:chemotaxis protein methyltransferase CheR
MIVEDQDVQLFVAVLKQTSGYDFSEYSEKSLKRRLAKVLMDKRLDIQ